jgi:hypothetical protein
MSGTETEGNHLELATNKPFSVDSSLWWNPTGLVVAPDEKYRITASGEWHDAAIPSSAAGYSSRKLALFAGMRRVKDADWFSLIAAVHPSPGLGDHKRTDRNFFSGWIQSMEHGVGTCDGQSDLVSVGAGKVVEVGTAGYLYLFANDAPFAYSNNHGAVMVTIERVR